MRILAAYDESEQQLIVHVVDNGKGITKEEMPHLCKQFGKLFRTAKMNNDGIGLGLMISKALIEHNGGRLQIQSDGADKGSVFSFTMKMLKKDNEIDNECHESTNSDQLTAPKLFGSANEQSDNSNKHAILKSFLLGDSSGLDISAQ